MGGSFAKEEISTLRGFLVLWLLLAAFVAFDTLFTLTLDLLRRLVDLSIASTLARIYPA